MSKNNILLLLSFLLIIASFLSCKKNAAENETIMPDDSVVVIKKVFYPLHIDSTKIAAFIKTYPVFSFHAEEIKTFYKNRDSRSAWFNEYGIVEQGGLFINLLDHFDEEGLKDSVIYYSKLKKQYNIISDLNYSYSGADSLTTQFELMLTAEFFIYAQKVWFGLNEKTTKELDWYITRKTIPSVSMLDSILAGGKNSFTAFDPLFPQYPLLKKYLKKYK